MDSSHRWVYFPCNKKDQKALKLFIHLFFEDLLSIEFHHPKKKPEFFDRNFNKRLRPILVNLVSDDPLESRIEGEIEGGFFKASPHFFYFSLTPESIENNYREKFNDLLGESFSIGINEGSSPNRIEAKMVFNANQLKYKEWKSFSFPSVHEDRAQIDIFKVFNNVVVKIRFGTKEEILPGVENLRGLGETLHLCREGLLNGNNEFLEMMAAYISSRSMFHHFEPKNRALKDFKAILSY